jgi:hypothetical protein
MSVTFSFNFMIPAWTKISPLDESTSKTVTFFPREETCTVSPTFGTPDLSARLEDEWELRTYSHDIICNYKTRYHNHNVKSN